MKIIKKITVVLLILTSILALCRCCTPRYNKPLPQDRPAFHIPPVANDSQTLMFACFSGGGTRAMAMGYYVVEELSKVYTHLGSGQNLRTEIDYTSGVSGGAFVSAALPVYSEQQWPTFFNNAVQKDIQVSLVLEMLKPWNMAKLMSPYYSRTDLAAEWYSKHIFKNNTFGSICGPTPLINATLLAEGAHIVFTDQYFQYINSDIAQYPLGFACAASSAFPGGFDPISLKNYGTRTPTESTMLHDPRYAAAMRNQTDMAQYEFGQMYRFLHTAENKWIHLSDGGIAGNTGIERTLDEWKTNGIINRALNTDSLPLRRLIFVVVNAGTEKPDQSCTEQKVPSIPKVILYTTSISMDILSNDRLIALKEKIDELWKAVQQTRAEDPSLSLLEKPYLIEINARNLQDRQLKEAFEKIPTAFYLPTQQLGLIKQVVHQLMDNNPDMIRLRKALPNDMP